MKSPLNLALTTSLLLFTCGVSLSCDPEGVQTGKKPEPVVLFDGESLEGWTEIDYAGKGTVEVEEGEMIIGMGEVMTGVKLTRDLPYKINYEITLEAKRIDGFDFFCALTFPIEDTHCTFVIGGWGGSLVGISSIDHMDAAENQTGSVQKFDKDRWYKIRLRVTETQITGWINDKPVVNFLTKGRHLDMRPGEIEISKPLGITAYQTKSAIRDVKMREISPDDEDAPKVETFE